MESYCQVQDVNLRATQEGESNWDDLTATQKTDVVYLATRDIEQAHGFPRNNDIPWGFGAIELFYICIEQSLYLSRVVDIRRMAEKITAATTGEYSDKIVTMAGGSGQGLTKTAEIMLSDYVRRRTGKQTGAIFKRG
jgi:hypothetical protein